MTDWYHFPILLFLVVFYGCLFVLWFRFTAWLRVWLDAKLRERYPHLFSNDEVDG